VRAGLSGGTTNATTLLNRTVMKEKPLTGSYGAEPMAATVACCEPENTNSMVPSGTAFCTAAAASAPAAAGRFSMVMRWPVLRATTSA
jgi:hypothetical protein